MVLDPSRPKPGARQSLVIFLSEPEIWAVVREFGIAVAPASPLFPLESARDTLDAALGIGAKLLAEKDLVTPEGRINWFLASAIRLLAQPQEILSLGSRGALGSRLRLFHGAGDAFVEHRIESPGMHALSFFWTRAQVAGEAAATLGFPLPAPARPAPGRTGARP